MTTTRWFVITLRVDASSNRRAKRKRVQNLGATGTAVALYGFTGGGGEPGGAKSAAR
jgi:hypothetical protein